MKFTKLVVCQPLFVMLSTEGIRLRRFFNSVIRMPGFLPVNVETEMTFRVHLLMTFMSATLLKMIFIRIIETVLSTGLMSMNLYEQHGIVYEKKPIAIVPNKKINMAYKALRIGCPTPHPIKVL